ncbi:polynucleotide kinase [uncultured phage cr85_1]|uniref:Polynucleotide kinase n=1 Tax=uncultured phage cr85_1 TaxID=2772074 RepID=A0A7M1RYI2_9CAUD|nr:phosphoheptose isomerase [uncultured phage cr85_1]QOR59495.1 polynucleotide kinase [uncultured phage cr85_1]
MIIAVDFDGTCVKHRYPMVGEDVDGAVSVLKELVRKGHKIILYTMRSGDTLDDAISWFIDNDIRNMLGKHQAPEREVLVNAMRRQFIVAALKKCYDVVIDGTLKPHENDFVRRCVKAHNSTVDELRSLGKLSPQDDTRYSIEYKDSIVPLQESIGEDATTATYKKTYKFIGIW